MPSPGHPTAALFTATLSLSAARGRMVETTTGSAVAAESGGGPANAGLAGAGSGAGGLKNTARGITKKASLRPLARLGLQTFKTKAFARFADREGLEDATLCEAVRRAEEGLIDADLGGGVIKQRIARKGGGRSGGFRTIMVYRRGELAFFVHGFAKSERDNLRRKELSGLRSLADEYLGLDAADLAAAQATGAIIEVECDDQEV